MRNRLFSLSSTVYMTSECKCPAEGGICRASLEVYTLVESIETC